MIKQVAAAWVVGVSLASVASAGSLLGPYFSLAEGENDVGYGAGAKYEYQFNENIGAEARASFLTGSDDDGDVIPLELGLVGLLPQQSVTLYGGIGAGVYIFRDVVPDSILGMDLDDPDPEVGFYALGGVRVPLSGNAQLFIEGKYTKVDFEVSESRTVFNPAPGILRRTTTVTVKGGLDGFGGNIGVMWSF